MIYDNSEVRRQDRLLDKKQALELLQNNEYGFLSMISEAGEPYGIPVNYAWDGRESIYIHCAPEGKKLRALRNNPKVSFCLVGNVRLMPSMFTTEYESVIFKGAAQLDLSDDEKMDALHLMIDKLSADFKELGDKYAHKSFHRVEIIRIDLLTFSGKCKRIHATKPNY
ncbi:pyridoxamine 5'-phosphate oxidase family protein [Prevotella sp. KH2C16]|uniref:pyridoxamine 5'-phosphate oxidase family protein n=1 Tax=Prevotella sp. KH2C16 TaxID=1855325 RepID=UPI000B83165D|nr:pyridoxamine 5'-phosphate oxidase family protein [Prevotella sp. KH2C16]